MTITQRIELRRLGYSKDEIAELAAAEAAAAAQPEPEPAPAAEDQAPTAQPEPAAAAQPEPAAAANTQPSMADVLTAINNLTTALQKQNINSIPQPVEPQPETATDIFTNLLKG